MAQPLSEGWWQQSSAESVWMKAQSATLEVSYLFGIKHNPRKEGDITVKYFQRKAIDGAVEIKRATYDKNGELLNAEYETKDGKYFFGHGKVVKIESKNQEDQIAAITDHPYEYKMLKPEIVGTNDCVVVARIMSLSFLNAMKNILYKGYSPQQEATFGGDFRKYISSEMDYYVRKDDAVIVGFVERNNAGDILVDRLYDVIQVGVSIPETEFVVPKREMQVATTFKEFQKIDSDLIANSNKKAPISASAIKWRRGVVITVMAISLGGLFAVLWIRFRRGKPSLN